VPGLGRNDGRNNEALLLVDLGLANPSGTLCFGKEACMEEQHTIFLNYAEILIAVQNDLKQYPSQLFILRRLVQLILGEKILIQEDKHQTGMWVAMGKKGKCRLITYNQLPEYLYSVLEKSHPPIETLAKICGCIFQERAYTGSQKFGEEKGVFIETGMESFKCLQCGQCCRLLDYHKELTHEDYLLWQSMGRNDIMKRVGLIREKGEIVSYRIWIDPYTHQLLEGCPWLKKDSEHNRYICRIHNVRPGICRQYPGSRKHARMTGCNAFNYHRIEPIKKIA
jgi:Fe-S-cluster containining protein